MQRCLQKGIETKFSSQYFRPVVSYFQNLPSQWSGNCSVCSMIQFKYRIEPLLACEKNCSNLISASPTLNLQQHSVSIPDLFTFRSIFCPLLLCFYENWSLQFALPGSFSEDSHLGLANWKQWWKTGGQEEQRSQMFTFFLYAAGISDSCCIFSMVLAPVDRLPMISSSTQWFNGLCLWAPVTLPLTFVFPAQGW